MPTYWLELTVTAEPEAVEAISEVMSRFATGGVAIEEPYTLQDDGQVASPLPGAPVTLRVYVPDDGTGEEARLRIEQGIWHLSQIGFGNIGAMSTKRLAEEDWANAWKEFYHVSHLGRRTVIKPSWREYEPRQDEVVIELDPGMAFGTGLHPTTRNCILALEDRVRPGDQVLDVGSGSGILSLAALKLGAGRVLALDITSVAVDATRANAAANGLSGSLDGRLATLEGAESEPFSPLSPAVATMSRDEVGCYDVVVANIIARVIAQLAVSLVAATRPGGTLIASGIIADRRHEAEEPLRVAGLTDIQELIEGDWITLVGKRAD
jgi:ribosomal protein L11 methyltransferase